MNLLSVKMFKFAIDLASTCSGKTNNSDVWKRKIRGGGRAANVSFETYELGALPEHVDTKFIAILNIFIGNKFISIPSFFFAFHCAPAF